jgi:hypothetical protein
MTVLPRLIHCVTGKNFLWDAQSLIINLQRLEETPPDVTIVCLEIRGEEDFNAYNSVHVRQ